MGKQATADLAFMVKLSTLARRILQRGAARYGYSLVQTANSEIALPVTPEESAFVDLVKPYSMTSVARILALYDALRYIKEKRILGDIVECGVWRGGNIRGIARQLSRDGTRDRQIWAFDTFNGMPPPEAIDTDLNLRSAASYMAEDTERTTNAWSIASLDEVKANVLDQGYPENLIHFVQGKVEETIPGQGPAHIALLRLDTDWYSSTKHELEHFFPRLAEGGVLIIDDYGSWLGARKAVDEYFAGKNFYFHRIDSTGIVLIKK